MNQSYYYLYYQNGIAIPKWEMVIWNRLPVSRFEKLSRNP